MLFPAFIENNVSYRLHEGKQHGIIYDTVPEDVKLVIAPDSSSNDYLQHQWLHERGCDVLVIDHHEAEKYSKYAVVINNQMCDYPTKSLSGVGMVLKFCQYIDKLLGTDHSKLFYDLAAFGIIADVMDLRDFETRYIVKTGLSFVHNSLFKKICSMQEYSINNHGGLNPFTVGWYIAPLVNAVTRSGTQPEKILFFEAMLDWQAFQEISSTKRGCKGQMETKAEQACRNARNIKSKQDKQRDEGVKYIEEIIQEKHLTENKIIAVKLPTGKVNRNFTGLIANQLLSKYQHPILLLSEIKDSNGNIRWEGSARAYECEGIDNFKEYLKNNSYVYLSEGHAFAFGVGLTDDGFSNFISQTNNELKDCTFKPSYTVDFIWEPEEINKQDILDLAQYDNIWGQGVEQPQVVIKNIIITKDNIKLLSPNKSPTIKIVLNNGVECIKYFSSQEEFDKLIPDIGKVSLLTLIGTCSINEFAGKRTPQITIKDYEATQQYYF
jgi:single-stranded-DNA-specific exonuclease